MIMMKNQSFKFVRVHADKEAVDRIQVEFLIFLQKLLYDEIHKISRKDQTSS